MSVVVHEKGKGKNHGRNSKRKNRPLSSRKHVLLVNDYLFGQIMEKLRRLNGVGLKGMLLMRLVCKTWSKKILDLPKWVWHVNANEETIHNKRIIKVSIENMITVLKHAPLDDKKYGMLIEKGVIMLKNGVINNHSILSYNDHLYYLDRDKVMVKIKKIYIKKKVNYVKITKLYQDHKFMLTKKSKYCGVCKYNGQGKTEYCYHCPYMLKMRVMKNRIIWNRIKKNIIKNRIKKNIKPPPKKDIKSSLSIKSKINFFTKFQSK